MNANLPVSECDVLVVGGGPGGSTAASLLRERGWSVVLIDKDRHPRFHIGESLLPYNLPIFDRLGVTDELMAMGVTKRGADFTVPGSNRYQLFQFALDTGSERRFAYQVRRAEFDHMLLRNAERKQVRVLQGTRARDVDFEADGRVRVTAEDDAGNALAWRARFLVDASGRDTWLGNRLQTKERNPKHNHAALYTHFSGVTRRPGDEAGNISIYWIDEGWIWMIPLPDGSMSIGAVCRPKYLQSRAASGLDPSAFLFATLRRSADVAARIEGASMLMPAVATGNYSYGSKRMYGDNYVMIGDAYAFVDPMFSSGVFMAMDHAEQSVGAIDRILAGKATARQAFPAVARRMQRGINRFSWFIYRFTSPAIQFMFTHPADAFGMRRAVFRLLAGDVFGRNLKTDFSLMMFRLVYWTAGLTFWRATRAHRRRRHETA